jgi:hypothetical protein
MVIFLAFASGRNSIKPSFASAIAAAEGMIATPDPD